MPNKKSGQQKKQQAKRERRSAQRKERAKRIAAQERDKRAFERALEIKRRRRAEFPDFVFREEHGNPEFVAIVKEAIRDFDFAKLGELPQLAFRLIKKYGEKDYLANTMNDMRRSDNFEEEGESDDYVRLKYGQFLTELGEAVFSHISDSKKRHFFPVNDVHFQPRDNVIEVKFRSLLTQKSSGGTIYYSRYKPTIDFEEKKYVVGFSTKALKRTCERTGWDPLTYTGLGNVYVYFESCQYFGPCTLRNENYAFSFFDEFFEGSWRTRRYAKHIPNIKGVDPTQGKLYYRVGYCPVVLDRGFAKAKTFLPPGFHKTPEYGVLNKAHMPSDTRRRLQRFATDSARLPYPLETSTSPQVDSLQQQWYSAGIPQLIQTTKPLYREAT